jgi:hypothetical protein
MRTHQDRPENPFERGVFNIAPHMPDFKPLVPQRSTGLCVPVAPFSGDVSAPYKFPLEMPKDIQHFTEIRASGGKRFLDIFVSSRMKDASLSVAEAKAAANTSDPAIQTYFEVSSAVNRELNFFLFAGKEQRFEDGVESEFSQNFVRIITRYKKIALDNLQKLIESQSINPEVLSEALRWLPRINDPSTYALRLSLITLSLFQPSSRVRDAATLALSSLADSVAVSALKKAIERENVEELREDMEQALIYLESIPGATSS